MRHYSLIDQLCLKTDRLLRLFTGQLAKDNSMRENPAKNIAEAPLSIKEKKHIAGLMRINYAGEVCAQALYQGQALTMRNVKIKYQLEKAGIEEIDHLYWCQSRLEELDGRVSFLNPLWYTGAFLLGMMAGFYSDTLNLGFLEETEKQVTIHLENHLQKLPLQDNKTRIILEKMKAEENAHAQVAQLAGAHPLPDFIKILMCFTSRAMIITAYWV